MNDNTFGWMGKILRIDLTTEKFEIEKTEKYISEYIGGRGIASRIAWDCFKKGDAALSEENTILIMTGPLTGTSAPYSGRTTICSLAPQGYPFEWYTRSSFGGHWGPELKYAGWDGIIITGKSSKPVYLMINNDKVELHSAKSLWGLGIFSTQKKLIHQYGKETRVFAIGPAGENLCRIAIAATETESASGQGGFGAVMGFKKLKAIVVRGNTPIKIAYPENFLKLCNIIKDESHASHGWPHEIKLDQEKVKKYGQKFQACTQQCQTKCYDARYYTKVPSVICKGKILAGQVDCIAGLFPGIEGTFYNWNLGFEAGFELSQLTNDLGLNHWEILVGMIPWLRDCTHAGYINTINNKKIDFNDPTFWFELLHGIAYRQGEVCNALAEGTVRGAIKLNLGEELLEKYFPSWGYAGHWDGHGDHCNHIVFPFWLVAALQWAMDIRDPISSGHGYTQNIMNWSTINSPEHGISWDAILKIGERIYGSKNSVDPKSSYEDKAFPALWHNHRSVIKDSLTLDDQIFPRIYSNHTPDHFSKVENIEGIDFEFNLLAQATHLKMTKKQFHLFSERVINLERMIHIKLYNRSRKDDESVIPYFSRKENSINPYIGEPVALNKEKFLTLMDEYYDLRGWDKSTGQVKEDTMKKCNLEFCL